MPYFDGRAPRVIAHRGFPDGHAENTIGAFQAALDAGVRHESRKPLSSATVSDRDWVRSREIVAAVSEEIAALRVLLEKPSR